ncbi:unnamed protein product, partial [Rotaria sordida]
ITSKETGDLEKQFDQSQIFLYELEGRETIKRSHHCLPYVVISLIQDGSQWPANFDDLDNEPDILDTDTLRVIALSDDHLLQKKLKENIELAEAATHALEHIYEEEPLPPVIEQLPSPKIKAETIATLDNTSISLTNGIGPLSSSPTFNEYLLTTSSSVNKISTNNNEVSTNSTVPSPSPSSPSSSTSPTPLAIASATAVATTLLLAHLAAVIQAVYRQTSLLGVLPTAAVIRAISGALYATPDSLDNGLTGQVIYGGIPLDALRGYQTTAATTQNTFVTHASIAQRQQAIQLAAVVAAQQQQQQQSLINGIPAGYTLVRTAIGGYALLAQSTAATPTTLQTQAHIQLAPQQQYITFNAAGQPPVTTARIPVAVVSAQPQQIVYQYAGQSTIQAAPTQYIQLPANYIQQQGLSTSPLMQTINQTNTNNSNGSLTNSPSIISSSSSAMQFQPTSTVISPQKQSAVLATAAAIQQQQYQHAYHRQQQQQQQNTNGTFTNNIYYSAMSQAQM